MKSNVSIEWVCCWTGEEVIEKYINREEQNLYGSRSRRRVGRLKRDSPCQDRFDGRAVQILERSVCVILWWARVTGSEDMEMNYKY